jgi:hypothetical protein
VNLHLRDRVGYQGVDYRVEGILEYHFDYPLDGRVLRLACLHGAEPERFLELPASAGADRLLLLSEIDNLDLTTPPPHTLYHRGESYLLKLSGSAQVGLTGQAQGRQAGTCTLWRYRAAGDQFLQIEQWPDRIRMLAGASVHPGMLEIRPNTIAKD